MDGLVANAAGPAAVAAAMPEAGLMTYEHLAWAKTVSARAVRRSMRDPLPGCVLYEIAQHTNQPKTASSSEAASLRS
jgi:hypothetical protein